METTPEAPLPINFVTVEDLPHRMWKKTEVDPGTGCWIWTGAKNSRGYGCGAGGAGAWLAHRRAYETLAYAIPDGYTIDHLCRTAACINPRHLEPVTMADNLRRRHGTYEDAESDRWSCGHEKTDLNTKRSRRGGGYPAEQCRECEARRARSLNARAAHARRLAKKIALSAA